MAKDANNKVKKIKIQIAAGKATPAPPVGTALGPAGINLGDFCNQFNEATRDKMGDILPVEITVNEDRSFSFVVKTPPAAFFLRFSVQRKSGLPYTRKEHLLRTHIPVFRFPVP